jgi:hypothetical protein
MIEPTHWIREAPPTIEITRASDLDSQPDAAFELARAPDGLPLVMHVRRAIAVRRPVLRALGSEGALGRELERALAELDRVARSHSVGRRIVRVGSRAYYETAGSVSSHFGATLLARMLGAVSPMVLAEDVAAAREPSRFENSVLLSVDELGAATAPAAPPATTTFGRDGRLWLGVSRDTPDLAVPPGKDLGARQASGRPSCSRRPRSARSTRSTSRRATLPPA